MDPSSALLRLVRVTPRLAIPPKAIASTCRYNSTAKQAEAPRKTHVGPLNDGGSARWKELSGKQKIMRVSNNASSFFAIIGGACIIGGVSYFLYQEVFAPDSKTAWFNRVVERVKNDKRCTDLIGPAETIKAYGEQSNSRWARNRPLASDSMTDNFGVEHLLMHFNVEGDYNQGTVRLHLEKKPGQKAFQYRYLMLEVPGKDTIYLESSKTKKSRDGKGLFGIQWTWGR